MTTTANDANHRVLLAFIRAKSIANVADATNTQLLTALQLKEVPKGGDDATGDDDAATTTPTAHTTVTARTTTPLEATRSYFVCLYMYSNRNGSKIMVTRYPIAYALTASIAECEPVVPLLVIGSFTFDDAMRFWNLWNKHCTKLQTKWMRGLRLFALFGPAYPIRMWCYTSESPGLIQAIARWATQGCSRGRITF